MTAITYSPSLDTAASSPAEAPTALTHDFLDWVAREPRMYAETLDTWHTHCPRLPVWEDAFSSGLVRLRREPGARLSDTPVEVTARGRALLGEGAGHGVTGR